MRNDICMDSDWLVEVAELLCLYVVCLCCPQSVLINSLWCWGCVEFRKAFMWNLFDALFCMYQYLTIYCTELVLLQEVTTLAASFSCVWFVTLCLFRFWFVTNFPKFLILYGIVSQLTWFFLFVSHNAEFVVIHNGIITNYKDIKTYLVSVWSPSVLFNWNCLHVSVSYNHIILL